MDETDNLDEVLKMVQLLQLQRYNSELENQLENVDFLSDDDKEWELYKFRQLAMSGQIFEV